ncbi:MAG TPA: GNAT family N-acetyltransferase, partial [Gammaproteobacteria bacterium]|nr:GNAT family N-acetyltransferase [Gammaproteobacteria bacterium]
METPPSLPEVFTPDVTTARTLLARAWAAGRRRLDEYEAVQVLSAYGLPVIETRWAETPTAAAELMVDCRQPMVLKILAPDVPQTTLLGGAASFLSTPEAVQHAAEER